MNLILCSRDEVDASGRVHLTGDRVRHVREVLHAVMGQAVRLGVIDGPLGTGTVMSVADDFVDLACAFDDEVPERPVVDLVLALPRPKVLRRLWAQLAAMGVGRIVLTNAEKVERNYFDTHWLSPATYQPLLIEGLQQARDTHLPLVTVHRQFRPLIEDELSGLVPDALRLVAHPGVAESIPDLIRERQPRRVLLAVGPEGGWNAFEMNLLSVHGFVPAAMGLRTLRTDTACVAALALAHHALTACRR